MATLIYLIVFVYLKVSNVTSANWHTNPPIKQKHRIQKPALMAMYLNPRRSNNALMATTGNAKQTPEIVPCKVPCLNFVVTYP